MDTGTYFWRNGEFVSTDSRESQLSVINHALHYGSGAFEGIRFYETDQGSAIFRSNDHYKRLHYSTEHLQFKIPYTPEELTQATVQLIKKNKQASGYIRPVAFYGEGKMGLNPEGAKEEVVIAAWPWGKYLSDKPIEVGVSPWRRIDKRTLPCEAKINGHYVNSILSHQWAKKNGFHEALLLDTEDNVAEGPGENIFIVRNGKLLTPKTGTILRGLTRDTIIQIAHEVYNIETEECVLSIDDILSADEAFFTGTAAEVTIIKSLDKKQIGKQDNKISEKLKTLYLDIVTGQKKEYHSWLTVCE